MSLRAVMRRRLCGSAAAAARARGPRADVSAALLSWSRLTHPLTELAGVGARTAALLGAGDRGATGLGLRSVLDVLYRFPVRAIDRSRLSPSLQHCVEGEVATLLVRVVRAVRGAGRRPHQMMCEDQEGNPLAVVHWCGPKADEMWPLLVAQMPEGSVRVVSGRITMSDYLRHMQMANPQLIAAPEDLAKVQRVEPVYPLTKGLRSAKYRDIVERALEAADGVPEWMSLDFRHTQGWPTFASAMRSVHNPSSMDDLAPHTVPKQRLAFDAMFAMQLQKAAVQHTRFAEGIGKAGGSDTSSLQTRTMVSGGVRSDGASEPGVEAIAEQWEKCALVGSGRLVQDLLRSLPFSLTECQKRVVSEILDDLQSAQPMARLLQGDVGSGKTIVALVAMLKAVEAGKQAVLLAPTEILATQHCRTIDGILHAAKEINGGGRGGGLAGLSTCLLTGALPAKQKKQALANIASGRAQLVIGTHALLSKGVEFASGDFNNDGNSYVRGLGLAIIDEEHRFGVEQRERLMHQALNTLSMTATPIPRSLCLAFYGDVDISRIEQRPSAVRTVTTRVAHKSEIPTLMEHVRQLLVATTEDEPAATNAGTKVFWVLPAIRARTVDEDGGHGADSASAAAAGPPATVDRRRALRLASVESRFSDITKYLAEHGLADRVVALHGGMSPDERRSAMHRFSEPGGRVLVATSIVELGLDIPDASVVIVEHAERFGLAQLHQIRGRVGRSSQAMELCECILVDGSDPSGIGAAENAVGNISRAAMDVDLRGDGGAKFATVAHERFAALLRTSNGFELAEEDLRLRGAGELMGDRQTGDSEFPGVDPTVHADALVLASAVVRRLTRGEKDLDTWWPASQEQLLAARAGEPPVQYLLTTDAQGASWKDGDWAPPSLLALLTQIFASHTSMARSGAVTTSHVLSFLEFHQTVQETMRTSGTSMPMFHTPSVSVAGADSDALDSGVSVQLQGSTVFKDAESGEEYTFDKFAPPAKYSTAWLHPKELRRLTAEKDGELSADAEAAVSGGNPAAAGVGAGAAAGAAAAVSATSSAAAAFSVAVNASPPPPGQVWPAWWGLPGAPVDLLSAPSDSKHGPVAVVLDLETTGRSQKASRAIQVAAQVVGTGTSIDMDTGVDADMDVDLDMFNVYINPNAWDEDQLLPDGKRPRRVTLPRAIRELTGIDNDFLDEFGVSFRSAWQQFGTFLRSVAGEQADGSVARPVTLLAHNGKAFDFQLLMWELWRHGEYASLQGEATRPIPVVSLLDTLHVLKDRDFWLLAHQRNAGATTSRASAPSKLDLTSAYEHILGRSAPEGTHNGQVDVSMLNDILTADDVRLAWRTVASRKQFVMWMGSDPFTGEPRIEWRNCM